MIARRRGEWRLSDLELGAPLYRCAVSEVWQAEIGGEGGGRHRLALKKVTVEGQRVRGIAALWEELHHQQLAAHPHVLKLYDHFTEASGELCILLELAAAGDLYRRIKAHGGLPESVAAQYTAEVGAAVSHCHRLGLVHRDIKPENVLLTSDGVAKLADFGMSARLGADGRVEGTVGTREYMAPEIFAGERYGVAVDVWSLGVMAHEMCSGRSPFKGATAEATRQNALEARFEPPDGASEALLSLLRDVLHRDAAARLPLAALLTHAWLQSHGYGVDRGRRRPSDRGGAAEASLPPRPPHRVGSKEASLDRMGRVGSKEAQLDRMAFPPSPPRGGHRLNLQ